MLIRVGNVDQGRQCAIVRGQWQLTHTASYLGGYTDNTAKHRQG